ncbi:Pectinesterase domain-containing protein/PMEI domain-containing protein, partial [Cephalotus follicularis]
QVLEVVQATRATVVQAGNWVQASIDHDMKNRIDGVALIDCAKLYNDSEYLLGFLLSNESYTQDDSLTWLSGVLANHRTCLDGLNEKGNVEAHAGAQNLTFLISEAMALYEKGRGIRIGFARRPKSEQNEGMLVSWNPVTSKADFVVAKDGSGTHKTIKEAVAALAGMGDRRPQRVIIYVKSGVYDEKVEIGRNMKNVMFVGDGIDRTIVTGNRNVPDGDTTYSSATFGVSGDGFWTRDVTFENTAGPQKHQAVALVVKSDLSVFYRCSFRGYQDTIWVHSLRQFYRDCHIYGTIDFIFGDASALFQNCDIFVRRPLDHQTNIVTAQGRDDPKETTGILIQDSRVRPAPEFVAVKNSYKSYLGRPWKKYSRTVFLKTDLDGLVHPQGWREWKGSFALSTLYYAEYMNTGSGAYTANRVKWPGFHVLNSPQEASQFTVSRFIQGQTWIPAAGVPFSLGI